MAQQLAQQKEPRSPPGPCRGRLRNDLDGEQDSSREELLDAVENAQDELAG